jgi:hypothetical protein
MQAKQSASHGLLALCYLSDVELHERGRGRQYNSGGVADHQRPELQGRRPSLSR